MTARLLFALLVVSTVVLPAHAQGDPPKGQRVFVCAHSFMIFTAELFKPMADAAKLEHVNAGKQMIGGSRVIQHWNLADDKNSAKKALKDGTVDVFLCSPIIQIPDEGIDNFAKLGLEKNPKLRVLVQASWMPYDAKDAKFTNEQRNDATLATLKTIREKQEGFTKKLVEQVTALNKEVGKEAVFVVPVGDAVITCRERVVAGKAPGLAKQTDLFSDNLGHAKPPLALLVAYCHYVAIYKTSPVGLPVPKQLKGMAKAEEMNTMLQEIAWDTVTAHPNSGVKKP